MALGIRSTLFCGGVSGTDNLPAGCGELALMLPAAACRTPSATAAQRRCRSIPSCIGAFRCSACSAVALVLHPRQPPAAVQPVRPADCGTGAARSSRCCSARASAKAREWPTYLAIWLAVLLLAAEGAQHLLRRQRV
ncbi:hypothetical protein M8494_05415 [Serratia ureilytica]